LSSGFREYFNADSVCLVEWPERAGTLLAPPDLDLALEFAGAERRAILQSQLAQLATFGGCPSCSRS